MSRAEFAILGAGAIGSLLAAHLARKGHCVTVLERGQRTQTIQNEGLQIRGLAEFSTGVEVLTERLTPRNNESAERVTEKKRM